MLPDELTLFEVRLRFAPLVAEPPRVGALVAFPVEFKICGPSTTAPLIVVFVLLFLGIANKKQQQQECSLFLVVWIA